MSAFDPTAFMNTQTEDASSTEYSVVPQVETVAVIDGVEAAERGGKPILEVKWKITGNSQVTAETGREDNLVFQTIWLDVTEQGGLDNGKGKNVGLGKLRAAVGQNKAGERWSPGMLVGQVAKISVTHRTGKEPGQIYAQVGAVAAA